MEVTFNSKELFFPNLPFFTGVLDSCEQKDLPFSLPFTLTYDKNKELIIQKYSEETEKFNEKAYQIGSSLSIGTGYGSFGVRRSEDVLKHISLALDHNLNKSFLEIGCGDGYLLHRLRQMGANKVLGCEPGPKAIEGKKKYGIEIKNYFMKKELFQEKFYFIFSNGTLEHVSDPDLFIRQQKELTKEEGIVFFAVPNCELKLKLGDENILSLEHWNYFTRNSLIKLMNRNGLNETRAVIGINNAMIYGWGRNSKKAVEKDDTNDKELFYHYCEKIIKNRNLLKERVNKLAENRKTIGFYGAGLSLLTIIPKTIQPRFFDTDVAKHGKYLPGYKNIIENPKNLLNKIVDELWITAVDYDDEITNYLERELKISKEIEIFSIKKFLESTSYSHK